MTRDYTCDTCAGDFAHDKGGQLPKRCPDCRVTYAREYLKRWNEDRPGRKAEYSRAKHAKKSPEEKKDKARREHRAHEYGLDAATFRAMVDARGGRCDICETVPDRTLFVDHDHKCCPGRRAGSRKTCGKCVRGLLCHLCNQGIGSLRDDPQILAAAIGYLTKGSD